MTVLCPHCTSTLANNYNLKRHILRKHNQYDTDHEDNTDDSADENGSDSEQEVDESDVDEDAQNDSNDQESEMEDEKCQTDQSVDEGNNKQGGVELDQDQTIDTEDATYTYADVIAILRFYLQEK